jgi:hypothetical protein
MNRLIANLLLTGALCLGLGGCNLAGEDDPPPSMLAIDDPAPSPTFSIGGKVAGATGAFVLLNSNGTTLNVARDGSFTFETPMVTGALYNVTVAVPPNSQTCVVAKGAGTMERANISDVAVTCATTTYTARNAVPIDLP